MTDPVIDRKPAYLAGEVPDGLLTLKQLHELHRNYAPDQEPAAWLKVVRRLRGKTPFWIAPLYALADSVPQRPTSPAQRAVLAAARDQLEICDYCGRKTNRPLQPQICCKCAEEFGDTEVLRRRTRRFSCDFDYCQCFQNLR